MHACMHGCIHKGSDIACYTILPRIVMDQTDGLSVSLPSARSVPVSLSLSPSVCLSVCLSLSLSKFYLSCLTVSLSFYMRSVSVRLSLFFCLLSIFLDYMFLCFNLYVSRIHVFLCTLMQADEGKRKEEDYCKHL